MTLSLNSGILPFTISLTLALPSLIVVFSGCQSWHRSAPKPQQPPVVDSSPQPSLPASEMPLGPLVAEEKLVTPPLPAPFTSRNSSRNWEWVPFGLPTQEDLMIQERDLLAGLQIHGPNNVAQAALLPQAGLCAHLRHTSRESKSASSGRTGPRAQHTLTLPPESLPWAQGALFLAIETRSGRPIAIGSFDKQGEARCLLEAEGGVSVLTGYGDARRETLLLPGATQTRLNLTPRALIEFQPGGGEKSVKPGAMLRIGRRVEVGNQKLADVSQLGLTGGQLQEGLDLFRPLANPSENFEATEVLGTTLLVGTASYSLPLEPGHYIFVILGQDAFETCTWKVELRSGDRMPVACPQERLAGAQGNVKETTLHSHGLDATFFSQGLLDASPSLRGWMQKRKLTLALRDAGASTFQIDSVNQSLQRQVYGPFAGQFVFPNAGSNRQMQMVRVLTPTLMAHETSAANDFYRQYDHTVVPLAGTGEIPLWSGAVPFLSLTHFESNAQDPFSPEKAFSHISNGTKIQWLEPRAGSTPGLPLRMPLQQRFRARVTIPKWNASQFVDVYVNGELYRRFVMSRTELSTPFVFEMDERIDVKTDFTVGLVAWGPIFLPELVFGVPNIRPLAMTQLLCMDVNENGICEAAY